MEFKLTHIAVWTCDIERCRAFYMKYFNGVSNEKYTNNTKGFASYFVSFGGGAAMEIMQRTDVTLPVDPAMRVGLAHMAFSVTDQENVNKMIDILRGDGYTIASEPRVTGDGFYEASVLDPDGNIIEIVA